MSRHLRPDRDGDNDYSVPGFVLICCIAAFLIFSIWLWGRILLGAY